MTLFSYLIFWFYILIPIVLYHDATRHKIGKIATISVGAWAALTQLKLPLLFIIPFYLFRRKQLMKQAKESPTERTQTRKLFVCFLLLVLSVSMTYFTTVYPYTSDADKAAKHDIFKQLSGLSLILGE